MTDIVERLERRMPATQDMDSTNMCEDMEEAIAEITALRKKVAKMAQQAAILASQAARIRELEEGLEPFAKAANELLERAPDNTHIGVGVLLGHLRRARSLLSRKGGE